jgi:hypothetical protein
MEEKDYILVKIEGEYAYLRELGIESDESDVFIALALLPEGASIGTKLHCAFFEYTIIE